MYIYLNVTAIHHNSIFFEGVSLYLQGILSMAALVRLNILVENFSILACKI